MKVVVIGAQAAGMSCVAKLKRNNPNCDIQVYEKGNYISFGACGLPYFVGDFFTNEKQMFSRTVEDFIKIGININLGTEVLSIDHINKSIKIRNLDTLREEDVSYDKLLIASGSRAKDCASVLKAYNSKNIYYLKTLEDGHLLKARLQETEVTSVAIIGSGYIGLEVLEALKQYPNIDISLIDSKDSITTNFIDNDFDEIINQELKDNNIKALLNQKITNIQDQEDKVVITSNGNDYKFDIIISAIGFLPNVDFLEQGQFDVIENGAIKINNKGETSIKDIYACGDVSAVYHTILKQHVYIPLATLANKIGRIIGDNLAGIDNEIPSIIGSSSLRLLGLEIAKTGVTEFEAKSNNISYRSVFIKDYNHTDYYPNQNQLYAKLIINEQDNTCIGATLVGKEGAAHRAHALTIAIEKTIPLNELAYMDFAYSPTFNRTWEFLNIVGNLSSKKSK